MLKQLVLRDSKAPKYQRIVDAIIRMIQFGIVRPGEALPTIEQIAEHLDVNRNTAASAYGRLSGQKITKFTPGKGMIVLNSAATRKLVKSATKDIEDSFALDLAWAMKFGLTEDGARSVCDRAVEQALRKAVPAKVKEKANAVRVDSPKKPTKNPSPRMVCT